MAKKSEKSKEDMKVLKVWNTAIQQSKEARIKVRGCKDYFEEQLAQAAITSTIVDGQTIKVARSSVSVKSTLASVSGQEAKRRLIEELKGKELFHLLKLDVNSEALLELVAKEDETVQVILSKLNIELVENKTIQLK